MHVVVLERVQRFTDSLPIVWIVPAKIVANATECLALCMGLAVLLRRLLLSKRWPG